MEGFSVLDMTYDGSDVNTDELFQKEEPKKVEKVKKEKTPWTPSEELIGDMEELKTSPVVYEKGEIKEEDPDGGLKDITEDTALDSAAEAMDDMERKLHNINMAKKRHKIKHFQIPPGPHQTKIFIAASDPDTKVAQAALDEIFYEIIELYPSFIKEWEDGHEHIEKAVEVAEEEKVVIPIKQSDEVKVVIDKTQVGELSWTKEEMDKLKSARTFELNIVEEVSIPYSQIEDADDNAVDVVLSQYTRKANDVVAALPASKYRATFTGLSYTEIMDLSYSQNLNELDGEQKRWSIAYAHIKNPSIGPFVDYEDFLKKTSFIDLEFILWKILCATSMDKEIITIDCHGKLPSGAECDRSYEWVYAPGSLLDLESINPAVLEEMKATAEAMSSEDIAANYKQSMLLTNNSVELPSSKFRVIFGHISAYDYIHSVYPEIIKLKESDNPMASQALAYSTLFAIKSFLIPKEDGNSYIRIKGIHNLVRILSSLNEIDWQTILELVKIMIEPYQFTYSLKDIVCPQCKNKSNITIDQMDKMLFLIARSLAAVTVTLKRS